MNAYDIVNDEGGFNRNAIVHRCNSLALARNAKSEKCSLLFNKTISNQQMN